MGCQKELDFAVPPATGAHLSFYWTMDEGGAANKVDSAAGLVWPLTAGTLAAPGLFSNGTEITPAVFGQHGLALLGTPDITINQATSTGISLWFWINISAYGTGIRFIFDTSDVLHSNRLRVISFNFTSALAGSFSMDHVNDTDSAQVISPNIAWALGTWHMIALTYDKTAQTLNIYLDGVLAATAPDPFVYPDLTNADFFLKYTSAAVETLDVVVDEFGLSTKGALTAAQVTALWNGGAGVTWPNITPIVPYP